MQKRDHSPARLVCFLAIIVASILPALAQSRLNGMVLNAGNSIPIESAKVTLQIPPGDATPEYEELSAGFGFFGFTNVAPREYLLKVEHPGFITFETNVVVGATPANQLVRLTPVSGQTVFDLFFRANCLASQAPLEGGTITAEYWDPSGILTGAPDAVYSLPLDFTGTATFIGMQDGYYRIRAERVGWEPLSFVPPAGSGFTIVGDKVRLRSSYFGSIFLRPVKTNLKVLVRGYDVVDDLPDQPLEGMTVHITGIGFSDDDAVLIPPVSGISLEDGTFTFRNLPPIRWKVEVARLGYVLKEVIVSPDADGELPEQVIQVELEPTKLNVMAESLYKTSAAVDGTEIQLQGIRDSNTDGIIREATAAADPMDHTASALFENLLPGRYWIHLKQETTISGLPGNSGVLRGPTSFAVDFFPKETYAEADLGTTTVTRVEIEPVPAVIRGRLMATDELANVLEERNNPEPHRVFKAMAHPGITFLEHELIQLLPETNNAVVVDTDAAGYYTALVPPGIFGVQIPTITSHTGHNIEFGNLTEQQAPRPGPWPYAAVWPYQTFEGGHHGAGLAFHSGNEYQLDLFLHRNYINIAGAVNPRSEPFSQQVLAINSAGVPITTDYSYLADVGTEVVAEGTRTYSAPIDSANRYLIQDVLPGTYTLRVNNPNYTTPEKVVTIAPWDPPGIIPSTAPFAPGYFFPGITHPSFHFTLEPVWNEKGPIRLAKYDWIAGDPPSYRFDGFETPKYFRMEGLPGQLFTYAGNVPAPSYTIWWNFVDQWFTASGSGQMDFEVFMGGPDNNISAGNAPDHPDSYTLQLRAWSAADRHVEIPDVTVQFTPEEQRAAGGPVPMNVPPVPTAASDGSQSWFLSHYESKVLSADTRTVELNVFMARFSRVAVKVTSKHGDIPNAAVVLRNRYGNPVRQGVTGTDGTATFQGITPQVLYIEVTRRGYIPQRKRFDVSIENPDITTEFEMEHVPAPVIDEFTMNRFGLFLPGVSQSKRDASESLTVTWKAEARGSNYTVELPGFMQPDETAGPPEIAEVVDRVAEVWVIDRRAFTNAFVNDLNQENFIENLPPEPFNYITVRNWIEDMTRAEKDGEPYYTIHQYKVRGERAGLHEFAGSFNLWELPSGVFKPMLLAITEGGGVAVMDYELPSASGTPEKPLQGMNLPKWAANFLDAIGVVSKLPKGETDTHKNYGDGFIKIGSISPQAESQIIRDPVDAAPEDSMYLTYKYVLGIELPLGEPTPESGPLNLGPKFFGFKFTGAGAEFEVAGKDQKAALSVTFAAAPGEDVEMRDKGYKPVLAPENEPVTGSAELSGKFSILETLDSDWLGRNRVSAFGYGIEGQGKAEIAAQFNATPVIANAAGALAGPAGPAVQLGLRFASRYDLFRVYLRTEVVVGEKIYAELLTKFPEYGATTTADSPERWDILGGTTAKIEIKFFARIAGGFKVSAARGAVEGTGLLQIGAPKNAADGDGVTVTVDPLGKGNLFTKIEGALSGVLRFNLNLWTMSVSKQWQWDAFTFVIDRGSEPVFDLVPLNITYTVIEPGTSAPQTFIGKATNIIDNFYAAGSLAASGGNVPGLVFSGVDAAGNMTVMVSMRNGNSWTTPVQLGTAGGVLSVAIAEDPAGGYMVAWSEIAAEDIGNPYPASTIKFARSDASGAVWSEPVPIASEQAALVDLKLARAGTQLLLTYHSAAEGPQGPEALASAAWDGSAWSGPETILPATDILASELSGAGNDTAIAAVSTTQGELLAFVWNGSTWSAEAPLPAAMAGGGLALAALENQAALAWMSTNNLLQIAEFNFDTGNWSDPTLVATNVLGTECEMIVFEGEGAPLYLVAWVSGADKTSIYYAYASADGTILLPPTEATPGSQGIHDHLQLRPLPGRQASLIASYAEAGHAIVREYTLAIPSDDDCDGDGVADDIAIASGLVPDCNANGLPDSCDLRQGFAVDRDRDGLLDACQEPIVDDCNRNGISDLSELAMGIGDLNLDGVLDDCESAVIVDVLPLNTATREMFYRAPGLRLKSRTATTIELEYSGTLEQAPAIRGPWEPVH